MPTNSPDIPSSLAQRICFVLLEPSHAGNIGAAARALRSMGFADLRVVAPRHPDFARHPDAVAFASGADQILAQARTFPSLDAALCDVSLAVGLSAHGREFCAEFTELQDAVGAAAEELQAQPGARLAFVFGTERTGLSIAQAQRCHRLCFIESDPLTSSLNVAQAVQVVAYVARLAIGERRPQPVVGTVDPGAVLVSVQEQEGMLDHLERSLVAIGFLDPSQPKRLMPRLRRQFNRHRMERSELDIWRGIASCMEKAAR